MEIGNSSEPLLRAIFGITSSIFDLWSKPWTWPDCWVPVEFLRASIPRKGSGSTTNKFYETDDIMCCYSRHLTS